MDFTINYLDLSNYVTYLHIFAPRMAPLEHILMQMDNIDAESWDRRGIVSS